MAGSKGMQNLFEKEQNMGDVSIIARRLTDGHVQYGWSGNGGYYKMVGARLLAWYQQSEDVEYLFELGQTRLIGQIGSEEGGFSMFESHSLVNEAFWLGSTERIIFSRIVFIDYGYFYDLDNKWYYIVPGPFRIKMPLELIDNNLDDRGYEFDYLEEIEEKILDYIFNDYINEHKEFEKFLSENQYEAKEVYRVLTGENKPLLYGLYDKYRKIYEYFDDWILIKTDAECTRITEIIMKKKSDTHVETNLW